MDKMETVKNIIKNNGGIAKTADFVAEGLTNYDVANLCKEGYVERVRHGYYQLAGQEDIKEEQVLASLLPESIVLRGIGAVLLRLQRLCPQTMVDCCSPHFLTDKTEN